MLQDLRDEQAVIHAIEDNTAEFLMAMGKADGADEKRSAEITWTIGSSPIDYHNAVVHAHLSPANADSAISEVITQLRAHNVPGTWHLAPSMTPADLPQRLETHGFVFGSDEPGMAAYLPDLREPAAPDGFSVTRVHEAVTLQIWEKTLAQGFGEGEREARWVASVYAKMGLSDHVPCRHHIGWLNGEPVATTSMYLGAGVAGIYFVGTVPQARRHGIGGAITFAALREAHTLGYQVGILGASSMGYTVYERLGFREFCNFQIYEWRG